jgi:glycosyltransferase involved in cell wall biosynthesis
MNILMFTNTFAPHVGGVARSVQAFAGEFRRRGHRVLVIAPSFEGAPKDETGVVRVPAVQHFHGSDFSVPLPSAHLSAVLNAFRPHIVHSHHPFLLGDTALRVAAARGLPVVFTHHTRYEYYTHYVPGDPSRLKQLAVNLTLGYCDLCDAVIAPSESVAILLREGGVKAPITVIPTGVDIGLYASGNGAAIRAEMGIPPEAFVVGHVGRLALEKNLPFLAEALVRFLLTHPKAHCLIAGDGPLRQSTRETFEQHGVVTRLHMSGNVDPKTLAGIYRAMDAFAFSSHSETQGLVIVEAMAASTPVVAVDAAGVREVVRDGVNGRLLHHDDLGGFVAALTWIAQATPSLKERLRQAAYETSSRFSLPRTAERMLVLYQTLIGTKRPAADIEASRWYRSWRTLTEEWKILRHLAHALFN